METLSLRERQVLDLIVEGMGDKQIAVLLSISRYTASRHVHMILWKLDVQSRTEAAVKAIRADMVHSEV